MEKNLNGISASKNTGHKCIRLVNYSTLMLLTPKARIESRKLHLQGFNKEYDRRIFR